MPRISLRRTTAVVSMIVIACLCTQHPLPLVEGQGSKDNSTTAAAASGVDPTAAAPAAQETTSSLSAGYGDGWLCGPLDQDVKGTEISSSDGVVKADCRRKCDADADCTFITYGYKAPHKLRCVLKKDWNAGVNGTTGRLEGVTFCCNQDIEPSGCAL